MQSKLKLYFTLGLVSVVALGGTIALATGGTAEDPLISKSYLETVVLPEMKTTLKEYVEELLGEEKEEETEQGGSALVYQSIFLEAGTIFQGAEGTELIVRTGQALAVCPGDVGLVDATGGLDLLAGLPLELNHVYIIPRADGRGLQMQSDGYLMVKGSYTIQ